MKSFCLIVVLDFSSTRPQKRWRNLLYNDICLVSSVEATNRTMCDVTCCFRCYCCDNPVHQAV